MWLDHYRGLLCDLDGCLVAGGRPLPGARALVAYARDRLIVVSNNSTDTPTTLAAKLARLNLPIAPERIVLDEILAIGDNPATDQEGARRMALPCVLVGSGPGAHFQSLAELMRSRGPPAASEAVPRGRLPGPEFLGDSGFAALQAPKSSPNGGR
jgi:ribonucleotide monophosphatase NagD (HAD superfamily)